MCMSFILFIARHAPPRYKGLYCLIFFTNLYCIEEMWKKVEPNHMKEENSLAVLQYTMQYSFPSPCVS